MSTLNHPKIRQWLAYPLPRDVAQSLERLANAEDVEQIAVMPDVHLAHDVCVGVAVATRNLIYPHAVGSDIGCGMASIRFEGSAAEFDDEHVAGRILADLYQHVPSLRHASAKMPKRLPEELVSRPLSHPRLEKLKSRDGRVQLGTLGRGNHFLEFQRDREDRLWLMVHSGSRGMGQAISSHHFTLLAAESRCDNLLAIDAESSLGQNYLRDMDWAIRYAETNRLEMIGTVENVIQSRLGIPTDRASLIHSNHNHVRRETHDSRELWVHRKGALSAQEGEPGVIPGSMGTASFHVAGRGCAGALCSSSHGAGRALSRTEAMQTISTKQLLQEMRGIWFDQRHASLLRDESPSSYKDIFTVMRAQRELTRIQRELWPVLSYKG